MKFWQKCFKQSAKSSDSAASHCRYRQVVANSSLSGLKRPATE